MERKSSHVLDTKRVIKSLKEMEKNKKKLLEFKRITKPLTLGDISKEFSKELGFKISIQAISYIKINHYDKKK